jgi:small subunit ribosomal protein S6
MRHYETIFIVHPDLNEEETTVVVDKFSNLLDEGGAFMVKEDHWGRRRMAYMVKKQNKGYFVRFEYGADAAAVAEMERIFKIDEQIIRFLTVKMADKFDLEAQRAAKAEAEAKAAADAKVREEEAAARAAKAEAEAKVREEEAAAKAEADAAQTEALAAEAEVEAEEEGPESGDVAPDDAAEATPAPDKEQG